MRARRKGFRGWVRSLFGEPRANSPVPWDDFWYGSAGDETESGVTVNYETALRTSAVFACVRLKAETIGGLPLHVYRRIPDGGKERADNHPLYDVLHDRPNAWQSANEFRETMQAHIDLRGNAYAQIIAGDRGWVTELWPVHPDKVTVLLRQDGTLVYRFTDRFGHPQTRLQDEMLHIRFLSLNGVLGLTPLSYARETIGRQVAMEKSNSRFHKNDATSRVALVHPSGFSSEEAAQRVITSWNAAYGGSANAHKTAILEEGMDIKIIGLKPEDAQFVESWEGGITDICRWFGVQPRKLGAKSGDSQTYSNVEQAQIEFVTDTVLPMCTRWEQACERALLLPRERGTYFVEFNVDGLLRADAATRGSLYAQALDKWMTVNEIRCRENLPPVPGGDEFRIQAAPSSPAAPHPDAATEDMEDVPDSEDPAEDPAEGARA